MDITPVAVESSSSSSDEGDTDKEQEATKEPIGPSTLPGPQLPEAAVPAPNWQLLQQMMMGVAQMQAMMRMPFAAAAAANIGTVPAAADGSSDEEEETDDEDESDEEETEDTTSSDGDEDGNKKKEKTAIGPEEAGSSRQGWELGGKVELKPKATTAQKRRARRRNLREEYKKMRKGKFWEIREMQKKKYGI